MVGPTTERERTEVVEQARSARQRAARMRVRATEALQVATEQGARQRATRYAAIRQRFETRQARRRIHGPIFAMADGPEWAPVSQPAIEAVAVVASAGGLDAISAVLRNLPSDLLVPVVVAQHLGGHATQLVPILTRRSQLPVRWARDGETLEPGTVVVCPPLAELEILPDRTCAVRPRTTTARDQLFDTLLRSLGDSLGAGGLAVVLTGMGRDGAAGTAALKAAGGIVLAQSEDTADHPSMPRAAAEAGADLVLPLHEIAKVLTDVVGGEPVPRRNEELDAIRQVFGRDGRIAALAAEIDWSRHPLGPVHEWPESRRTLVALTMRCPQPAVMAWGGDLLMLMNERAIDIIGDRYQEAFARPNTDVFPETWSAMAWMYENALGGQPDLIPEVYVPFERDGRLEDAWWDFSFTPIREADGSVTAIFETFFERTEQVLSARRLAVLNRLAATPVAPSRREALERALAVLADAPDVPFAVAYLLDRAGTRANLVDAVGTDAGGPLAPLALRLGPCAEWPLHEVVERCDPVFVDDLGSRFRGCQVGPAAVTPESAVLHPLCKEADDGIAGVVVLGTNPRLVPDDRYREFLGLVAETITSKVAESHARQRERERLERLAELDRAKTEFFSNVSHEFRTPLTLMLGPIEELLRHPDGLPPERTADLELIHRNARRLLRLVGSLLDFSQLEAGRLRADFRRTDLGEATKEIVAQFETAAVAAGVALRTSIEPLPEPVWVDREMWEKIVSNLVSNALKFTFDGGIEVSLHALPKHAELVVRDTGVGIPEEEQPLIFKRFHRVHGSRARTHEGAGIGLALVDELVRRHQGRIRVKSSPGEGSTFTVWIPLGRRPPPESPRRRPDAERNAVARALADEAAQWDSDAVFAEVNPTALERLGDAGSDRPLQPRMPGALVLVVDDNPDMREYLRRLLDPHWAVDVARDGDEALTLARQRRPDLIVCDVMMPGLDGFGLLGEIRRDEKLAVTPVVFVTARAGEETAIEGLLAGANDYIVKPFSARELIARVGAQIELARLRAGTEAALAAELRDTQILQQLASRLTPENDVGVLYHEIVAAAMTLTEADGGTLQIFDPDRRSLTMLAFIGLPPELPGHFAQVDETCQTSCGIALAKRERVFVTFDDSDDDGRRHLAAGLRSAQSTPLIARSGQVLGMFSTHWRDGRRPSERQLRFLDVLARQAADLIERTVALRDSEERYRALVEASAGAVWTADAEGLMVDDSPSWRAYTGQTIEEWLGTGWLDAVHPEDREAAAARWRRAVEDATPLDAHFRLRHAATGGWRLTRARAVPLFHPDGRIRGWVGMNVELET